MIEELIGKKKEYECTTLSLDIATKDKLWLIAQKHHCSLTAVLKLAVKEFLIRYNAMQRGK